MVSTVLVGKILLFQISEPADDQREWPSYYSLD